MLSQLMQCGGCGCDKFNLYEKEDHSAFYAKCTECNSFTEFSIYKPMLRVSWVKNDAKSQGIACVFPDNNEQIRIPTE